MSYCLRNPLSTAERRRRTFVCLVTFCLFAAAAEAQDDSDQHGMPNMPGMSHETPAAGWLWMTDASAYFGFNDQERKFTDFSSWESQNWVMLDGAHRLGRGIFRFHDMHTLE